MYFAVVIPQVRGIRIEFESHRCERIRERKYVSKKVKDKKSRSLRSSANLMGLSPLG